MLVEPTAPRTLDGGGERRRDVVVLHPSLAGRYTALVAAVAPAIERRLSDAVGANRVAVASVDPPSLVLRPWRSERAAFGRRLARLARSAPSLLFADVASCYRSIAPDAVERGLAGARCDRWLARDVATFLRTLAGRGTVGLPVGPDPSAVLANAVLADVDDAIAALGTRHLRWVDDLVVSVRSVAEAASTVETIRATLATAGLSLNEAKTRLVLDPAPNVVRASISAGERTGTVG